MITWLHNKAACIVSLPTSVHEVTEGKVAKKSGDQLPVQCPHTITTMYNEHMSGVDKNYQLMSHYSIICR